LGGLGSAALHRHPAQYDLDTPVVTGPEDRVAPTTSPNHHLQHQLPQMVPQHKATAAPSLSVDDTFCGAKARWQGCFEMELGDHLDPVL